jgi:very-short-patch-repair endonuclease
VISVELALRLRFFQEAINPLLEAENLCASPIEKAMFWGLLLTAKDMVPDPYMPVAGGGIVAFSDGTIIQPQREVTAEGRKYRLDLAVVRGGRLVAVELDGHEFHERSRRQASYDKARDRALQLVGWRIARFSGSDVCRDPYTAARDVWRLADAGSDPVEVKGAADAVQTP